MKLSRPPAQSRRSQLGGGMEDAGTILGARQPIVALLRQPNIR